MRSWIDVFIIDKISLKKKFNIFSSEKKLPQKTENNTNFEAKTENKFLTPMLLKFNSKNGNEKDNLTKTN